MEYAGIGVVMVGLAVGTKFRLKVLLPLLPLLVVASIIFALTNGYSFGETLLIVGTAQVVLQVSYFAGVATRAFFSKPQRTKMLY
jgi:hypothetical protein